MLHTSPYKNEFTKIGDGVYLYPQKITKKSKVLQNLKLSASMPHLIISIMNRATIIYIDITSILMYIYENEF